jgi:nitrogen fixation/metabolism regulation signal transduction histidine kinase
MRAFLYANLESAFSPGALLATSGPFGQAEKLAPLIEETRLQRRECSGVVDWRDGGNGTEQFHTIPLFGRGEELLAVLLVGSSRDELLSLKRFILRLALAASAGGIFLGLLVSAWITKRVSHPVRQLAESARRVAAGQWDTRVRFQSRDEIGQLADAFNRMTQQLSEQRDKLIQAERVAAWRELARRLAHELKNPLFPLQITVENLERAKQHHPKQFDEVFRESTATLTAELSNLKTIISRFSDFSRMPPPQIEPVDINSIVQQVLRLFDAQFQAVEAVVVHPQVKLDETLCPIEADPDQIKRALQNLVLNALDAMPSGGTLTVETHGQDEQVEIKVSDTGAGLTSEERERIFTPYYTSKQHGTGLGLAIVQAVVSDHGGKVSVASQPGRGTTFCMTIPVRPKVQT